MSFKLKIITMFSLSIVVLIVTAVFAYKNISDYKRSSEWVHHTQKVISQVQRIQLDVEDIETEQRGYVITGNEKYLEYYNQGLDNIYNRYTSEKALVADNPEQLLLLDSIFRIVEKRIEVSKEAVSIRRHQSFDKAKEYISKGRGEMLMTQIRVLVEGFIDKEEALLSQRLADANKHFTSAAVFVISSIILAIIIVVVSLYFFILDYNKVILSEKKVSESELRIKKMLDSLPVGVFIVDTSGTPYFANAKSKQILGQGIIADVAIEKLPEVYHAYEAGTDNLYPRHKMPILKALKGETTIGLEEIEIRKGDTRIPLRSSATYITDSENKIAFAISVFEDITDVKEYERNLKEAKKIAEESVALKEAFLANMSHEIRTPMNAIIGFTNLLLKRNLSTEDQEFVKTIKTSGENLLRIINDILDVSKMDSGLMTFEEFPISIREIFGSLHTLLQQTALDKKLHLSFASTEDIPETLLGDPTRLTQIILNIAGNALKFTPKGSVEVNARLLRETPGHCEIAFSVKDTGIGIPEDKLAFIFERFRQAEAHTTRNYGGTGLGLSIAKQLIELQHGSLSIRSMEGVGSVFSFTLPFKKAGDEKATPHHPYKTIDFDHLRRLSLLLIEDNAINIKFIQSLFAQYGLSAEVAENGKLGIEKLRSGTYDLVLMDIEMPGMNGYQATAYIREELNSKVPVIAMTAHAMAGEKEKCLQMGMNDYISKPINADLLFEKMLAATISNEKAISVAPVMNLGFLSRSVLGNKEAIISVIGLFLEQIPEDLQVLQEAISREAYDIVKSRSHKMRSSVSVMGMDACTQLLEEMESLAKQAKDIAVIDTLYQRLSALCTEAIVEATDEKNRLMA